MSTTIRVTTTVTITDHLGREVAAVMQTAEAQPMDNPRYWATYTRGAVQTTEHDIATMLIAKYGDKPDE